MTLVFGYGSLIQSESRQRTVPSAAESWPIEIQGLNRCWNARTGVVGFSTTFLGIDEAPNSTANGVAFWADDQEVDSLIKRESGYSQKRLPISVVNWLGSKPNNIPDSILVFCFHGNLSPSNSYPIIQSYVDICVSGCLDVDEVLGSIDFDFTRSFLRNTSGWSTHWVNDRIQPRAPFRHCPQASRIDNLLSTELPEQFQAIRIE